MTSAVLLFIHSGRFLFDRCFVWLRMWEKIYRWNNTFCFFISKARAAFKEKYPDNPFEDHAECEINLKSYRNYLGGCESPNSDNLYSLPHKAYAERNKAQEELGSKSSETSAQDSKETLSTQKNSSCKHGSEGDGLENRNGIVVEDGDGEWNMTDSGQNWGCEGGVYIVQHIEVFLYN